MHPGDDMMENRPPASNRKPGYDFGISSGFVAFTAYRWASTIVQERGQRPSVQVGPMLGIALGFSAALLLVDYVLWRWGFTKAIRSGLWAAAAIGPHAGAVAWVELAHPVWSQVIGFTSTILAFVAFYCLDRRLERKRQQ